MIIIVGSSEVLRREAGVGLKSEILVLNLLNSSKPAIGLYNGKNLVDCNRYYTILASLGKKDTTALYKVGRGVRT